MSSDTLNLIGLVLNLIGTIATAFAAGQYIYSIHAGVAMLETTLEAVLDNALEIPSFRNAEEMRTKTRNQAGFWTKVGVVLIVIGFALQVVAILLAAPHH